MKHYINKNWKKTLMFLAGMLPEKEALKLLEELFSDIEEARFDGLNSIERCRDLEFLLSSAFESLSLKLNTNNILDNITFEYLFLERNHDGKDYRDNQILSRTFSLVLNGEVSITQKVNTLVRVSSTVYSNVFSSGLNFNYNELNYVSSLAIVDFIQSKLSSENSKNAKFIYDLSIGLQETEQIRSLLEKELSITIDAARKGYLFQLYFPFINPTETVEFLKRHELDHFSKRYTYLRMRNLGSRYIKPLIELAEHFPEDKNYILAGALGRTEDQQTRTPFWFKFTGNLRPAAIDALKTIDNNEVAAALIYFLSSCYDDTKSLVAEMLLERDTTLVKRPLQDFCEDYKSEYANQKGLIKSTRTKRACGAVVIYDKEEEYAQSFVTIYEEASKRISGVKDD